jgi:hypothetical protein
MFLRNVGNPSPHGVTTQKTNIDIFTAVRASDPMGMAGFNKSNLGSLMIT